MANPEFSPRERESIVTLKVKHELEVGIGELARGLQETIFETMGITQSGAGPDSNPPSSPIPPQFPTK